MGSSSTWRSETEGRLRKAQVSLEAARALIDRKPPCNDDAVNRASAAALQAARALVDARWPPHDQLWDPTWRPGMPPPHGTGPYSKASWPVIVQQFEKASLEMALPFDAAEYLKTLVEDGHASDLGDNVYEASEAVEAVDTAEKLVKSVTHSLPLAFALGYRELDGDGDFSGENDEDENATTLEVMPVGTAHPASAPTDPHLDPLPRETVKAAPPAQEKSEEKPADPPKPSDAAPPPASVVASPGMPSEEQHSQRRSPRVAAEVMVAVLGQHNQVTGWGTNLSATGVFVNTQNPAPVGAEVRMLLQLPGVPECKLRAKVMWSKAPGENVEQAGMGVQFIDTDPPTLELLAQMVKRLTVDLAPGTAA